MRYTYIRVSSTDQSIERQKEALSAINAMESTRRSHYLLQTRPAVLNGELEAQFELWYPEVKLGEETENHLTAAITA
ncbi:hypothetical protein B738_04021 [Photorhabdus temperata subsp. temperata M1021]|nr:hypothetical protein B738_04021 [Photorhabdus temperata subsp. temperata M1021]